MLPKLLIADDIKDYLHLGNTALYELLGRSDFPSFKVKHKYYIIEDDFIKWMEDNTHKRTRTLE